MKTNVLVLLLLGLLNSMSFSQNLNNTSYISGKVKVPLLVDQTMIEDHFLDDRRDSKTEYKNAVFDIYTQLKNIPIYFKTDGKNFSGYSIEKVYDLVTIINVFGKINPETNRGIITIIQTETKNTKSGVCDYDYEYSYEYEYKNLKVRTVLPIGSKQTNKNTSYFFKPDENTELTVKHFKYIEDTECPKRDYSKVYTYKQVNQDYLNEKLGSHFSYFTFNVNWNGKTIKDLIKESITIKTVREKDPTWEPPITPFLNEGIEAEPTSIGIYFDKIKMVNSQNASANNNYKALEQGFPALITADLAKVPELKILERKKISKILQEIELSNSGLVREDTKVKNKLMKEEMAIKIGMEIDEKNDQFKTKCHIVSKQKEIVVSTSSLPLRALFGIKSELLKEILKETKSQFNLTTDFAKIYQDPSFNF